MLEISVVVAVTLVLSPLWRRNRLGIFVVVLLVGEFFHIQIGDGFARIYHFLAILAVIGMARRIPALLRSRVFITLILFVLVNLCAIAFADAPERAAASFMTVLANVCIAMTTALLLASGRVTVRTFRRLVMGVTLISVGWGLTQIVAFRLGGLTLALSEQQMAQIVSGFGPAFRTEANTFGKSMVLPFMLFLPEYLEYRQIRGIRWVYLTFIVGVLINFTRSAIYGMGLAAPFVFGRYVWRRRMILATRRSIVLAGATALGVSLMLGGALSVSEYAAHKIINLFSRDEILGGGSSSYRLEMADALIEDTFSTQKKVLIGNGWGQTRLEVRGTEVQAGAGDIINVWAFSGVFGALLYVVYMWQALSAAYRRTRKETDPEVVALAEGTTYAVVAVFITAQMAGAIAAPEYWLLIGIAMYLGMKTERLREPMYAPSTVERGGPTVYAGV